MTVSSTSRLAGPFTGTGADATDSFTFKVFAVGDIQVVRDGATLTLNSHYTVSLNANQDTTPGGSVRIFAAANTLGSTIYVTSRVAASQPTSLPAQSVWFPKTVEKALDRLAVLIQQLLGTAGRTFTVPLGETGGTIPPLAERRGKFPVYDASGNLAVTDGMGADASLRPDLAANGGAALVGTSTGESVEERLADLAAVDAQTPFVLVISGQSNAAGANSGGANPASPNVKTWNGVSGTWGGSDYTASPWTLSNPDGNGGHNNFALAAAHRINAETGRPVYIIFDAVGGTSIDQWVGSGTSSARYAALKTKIVAALASSDLTAYGIAKIDAMIWSQGEEDAPVSFATHLGKLTTLNAQLRAEAFFDPYTPIIVTGMSDLHERFEVSAALRHFPKITPGWLYVSSEGLPTADNTHFLGAAYWDQGYNVLGPLLVNSFKRNPQIPFNAFYNRGNGRLTQGDSDAIATFDNVANWSSRTGGPGVTDTFTGDGATTAFTLTVRNTTPASVTVGGVAKATPADYSIATTGTGLPVLTFTAAPANAAAIIVAYPQAVNGPAAVGSKSWGYRCYADGNYTLAGGYLTYSSTACLGTILWGRELTANDSADYSGVFGFQNDSQNLYQGIFGRGHVAAGSSEFICGTYSKYQDGSRRFQIGIGPSVGARRNAFGVNAAQGNVEIYAPSTAADPGETSELTFALTSNTTLVVKVKGTDGTVRSATLTLS